MSFSLYALASMLVVSALAAAAASAGSQNSPPGTGIAPVPTTNASTPTTPSIRQTIATTVATSQPAPTSRLRLISHTAEPAAEHAARANPLPDDAISASACVACVVVGDKGRRTGRGRYMVQGTPRAANA
eukprot:scaffold8224_cov61-Phaeocystis_antarctica.AAC.6